MTTTITDGRDVIVVSSDISVANLAQCQAAASSAEDSASTATTKASEAAASESAATTKASEAAASAAAAADSANRVDLGALDAAVAATAADVVSTGEDVAATAADRALAETARVGAETAETAAETARDAAFVNADVYVDEATGRAAVADGEQFQVVDGDEIIRYERVDASTSTEVARYPSANIWVYQKLLRVSAADRAAGFEWSLADWYLEDTSRISQHAWYDATDTQYLYQDSAGSTAATTAGQDVELIKAVNGHSDHDLLIHDAANPAVLRNRAGKWCVDLNNVAGFKSRANVTLQMPLFLAASFAWRSVSDDVMGVIRSSVAYLKIMTTDTAQRRPYIQTNGSGLTPSEQGYNPAEGEFGLATGAAPMVVHSQFAAGTNDITVNDQEVTTDVNTWTGAGSDSGAWITVGMATNTVETDGDLDFYGGFVYFGTISDDLRTKVAAYLKRKAERVERTGDRNILVIGDSTGDNGLETTGAGATAPTNGDWPYRLAGELATDNPSKFVGIRKFEDGYEYGPLEHLTQEDADGIIVFNGSIAGSQPGQALGGNFDNIIKNVPVCDTVIINHGYNIGASATTEDRHAYAAAFMGLIEEVKRRHPKAHLFLTKQADTDAGATYTADMHLAIDDLAALYGASILDLSSALTVSADYSDGLHPSEQGAGKLFTAANTDYDAALPIEEHSGGFLDRLTTNLLDNGQFFDWTAGVPDDWTKSGSGGLNEVAVVEDDSGPVAVQIDDSGSTSTYIEQSIDGTALQGQTVTIGVRMLIEPDSGSSANSKIEIVTDGTGGGTTLADHSNKWSGGWMWGFSQCDIPADATTITVRLYGRGSGTGGLAVSYSQACLAAGNKPRREA